MRKPHLLRGGRRWWEGSGGQIIKITYSHGSCINWTEYGGHSRQTRISQQAAFCRCHALPESMGRAGARTLLASDTHTHRQGRPVSGGLTHEKGYNLVIGRSIGRQQSQVMQNKVAAHARKWSSRLGKPYSPLCCCVYIRRSQRRSSSNNSRRRRLLTSPPDRERERENARTNHETL